MHCRTTTVIGGVVVGVSVRYDGVVIYVVDVRCVCVVVGCGAVCVVDYGDCDVVGGVCGCPSLFVV